MIKIHPIIERFLCIFAIFLFGSISVFLFVKSSDSIILFYIPYLCIIFVVAALMKLFSVPCHIIIGNNMVRIFDFPLLATNNFFEKKRSLILWNSEIHMDEIEKIEIVKLTRKEQKRYVGYRHWFSKYLKFTLKYGHFKYVHVGGYSNRQIKKIINLTKHE